MFGTIFGIAAVVGVVTKLMQAAGWLDDGDTSGGGGSYSSGGSSSSGGGGGRKDGSYYTKGDKVYKARDGYCQQDIELGRMETKSSGFTDSSYSVRNDNWLKSSDESRSYEVREKTNFWGPNERTIVVDGKETPMKHSSERSWSEDAKYRDRGADYNTK